MTIRVSGGSNLVENLNRPSKLAMKNWMFFGSLEAGTNNALLYTLLANCHAQGLNREDYLIEVLKRLPHNAAAAQAAALTPLNKETKACTNNTDSYASSLKTKWRH